MATCKVCNSEYPDERLEAGYPCCIACSPQHSYLAVEGGDNKTGYGVVGMVHSSDAEAVRRLNNTAGQTVIPRRPQHRKH